MPVISIRHSLSVFMMRIAPCEILRADRDVRSPALDTRHKFIHRGLYFIVHEPNGYIRDQSRSSMSKAA